MADSDPATKKDLQELEARMDAKLNAAMEAVVDRLTELVRNVETNLLTCFHGYGKGQAGRMTALEVGEAVVKQRLDALEPRVLNLETRRPY
jgi:hypothetical protein